MPEAKDSPHGKERYGAPDQRNLLGGLEIPKHKRKSLVIPVEQVTLDSLAQQTQSNPSETPTIQEESGRRLKFKKGAVYYTLEQPVPRTRLQAQDRKAGQLMFEEELEIHQDDLKWSEKLQQWTPYPKAENKSKEFGAFIKVKIPQKDKEDNPIRDGKGKIVFRTVWMSLKDRSGQNNKPLFLNNFDIDAS